MYSTACVDVLRRSASGWGTVFSREHFKNAQDVKTVLSRLPGISAADRGIFFQRCRNDGAILSAAVPNSRSSPNAKVQVYIDGVRVSMVREEELGDPITTSLALVSARDIEYMEVYRGVAQIPAEFLNDACAVSAIWTRAY